MGGLAGRPAPYPGAFVFIASPSPQGSVVVQMNLESAVEPRISRISRMVQKLRQRNRFTPRVNEKGAEISLR
jgi:hypothetical protein